MLLSSCVVWRHLEWERFRAECPGGDERLQRLIWERLDDALAWLESLGAEPVWRDTENPLTTGRRYDPRRADPAPARGGGRRGARDAAAGRRRAAAPARDRRLCGTAGARARAAPAGESVERGRRARLRARSRRRDDAGHGRVLRPRRCRLRRRGSGRRTSSRSRSSTAARRASSPTTGSEITPRRRRVARERPRAARSGRARGTCVEETNERIEAARAAGGTVVGRDEGLAVHVAGRGDAHDRRPPGRRRRRG